MADSQAFYLDEEHSRTIRLEWTADFSQVDIYDDDQILHQHQNVQQLEKGIMIRTRKGENLYIRLYKDIEKWEVLFGNRYLINSYNRSLEVLSNASQIFYYIFFASVGYLIVLLLPMYRTGQLTTSDLINPTMLLYYGALVIFFLSAHFVKKGKLLWYYLGTGIYMLDTILVILTIFFIKQIPFEFLTGTSIGFVLLGILAIRMIFALQLLRSFKHVVAIQKHKAEADKEKREDLLDG